MSGPPYSEAANSSSPMGIGWDLYAASISPLTGSVVARQVAQAAGEAGAASIPTPAMPLVFGVFADEGDPAVLADMLGSAPLLGPYPHSADRAPGPRASSETDPRHDEALKRGEARASGLGTGSTDNSEASWRIVDRASRASDDDYLREIERLAHQVVEEAAQDGSLSFSVDDGAGQTQLEQAINVLARSLRFRHHERDGCAEDHQRPR